MNKSPRQNNKETLEWNHTLDQMDLICICRTYLPIAPKYTFFSSAHDTVTRINHKTGHKTTLANLKRLKSYQVSFPTTILWIKESITEGKLGNSYICRLNNMILNKPTGQKEDQEIPWNKQKCKHNVSNPIKSYKSSSKKEVYSDKCLH